MNNITSPSFTARTTITSDKNILTKDEIKTLTKLGERIGVNSDTISFSLRNQGDNIGIAHRARFNLDGDSFFEQNQAKIMSAKNLNPFEYVKTKLDELKTKYIANTF